VIHTGEVNVQVLGDGHPVGHQLQGNDVEKSLETVDSLGHLDLLTGLVSELLIVLVADDDGTSTTSNNLLVGVQGLAEDSVTGKDHDDGEVLIDQSQNSVLQLSGHDGLTVKVRNLLNLQGTLKGSGELVTTSKKKKRLLVLEELSAKGLDGLVLEKDLFELVGNLSKSLHNVLTALLLGCSVLTKGEGEHDQSNVL
jgi:hypothetical protein